MTDREILSIAMAQSAVDSACDARDFLRKNNVVVLSQKSEAARRYLELPFLCDLTSYGSNIVASVSEELQDIVTSYINRFPVERCFETPNLHVLMDTLRPLHYNVCFMAEYFLPKTASLPTVSCAFETRVLEPEDFAGLYLPQWHNALCEKRRELDILGVGAYRNGELVGLAGCSADCDTMWQIGVDVLPAYRRQGVARAITNRLAREVLAREIVPFYCCAWSNLGSARNAVAAGFSPAWVQLTVKPNAAIDGMNKPTQ